MKLIAEWLWAHPWAYLKWGGALLFAFSISNMARRIVTDPTTLPHRLWRRYVAFLNAWLRRLFLPPYGAHIAASQLVLLFAVAVAAALGLPGWYALAGVIMLGPYHQLKKRSKQRAAKLEAQVVPFTVGLANALKTTANIRTALEVLEPMLAPPLKEDLALALKEIRVGNSLDQSLLEMSARSRCPEFETTLAAVLIGRQVGGNLPEILGTTAGTLREMVRLAGAVRSKTASGRTQLWVLGCAPGVVLVLFELVKPGYFKPLTGTAVGWIVCMIIPALWVFGVVMARKVMRVEL